MGNATEQLWAARPLVTACFPYAPDDASIVADENETQIRFVDLQPNGTPNVRHHPALTIDVGIATHEWAHELEAQLVRAGDTKPALRTALWLRRGFPNTQEYWDANATQWGEEPVEVVAESISRAILGPPWTERHTWSYIGPINHDDELSWWQARFAQFGVEVPAMRTFTFSMALTNGNADRIGAAAISLTEAQRSSLRLISGQGRKYGVDIARVGLTGTETTLPDTRGWVTEDTTVAIGLPGRWKLNAMARRDFGSVGWYEARFIDVTAAI